MATTIKQVYDQKFGERDHEFSLEDVVKGMLSNKKATRTNLDGTITEYGVNNANLLYTDFTGNTDFLLDQATRALLYNHFKSRKICTNDQETIITSFDEFGIPNAEYEDLDFGKFIRFYNETLLNCEGMYKELLRLELTKIDPMVSDYFEYWYKDTGSKSGTGTGSITKTPEFLNKETTVTKTGTVQENGTANDTTTYGKIATTDMDVVSKGSDNRTIDLSDRGTTTENSMNADTNIRTYDNYVETDASKQAAMAKSLPNSISYSGVTGGNLPALNWGTGSSQNQTEGHNSHGISGSIEDKHTFSNASSNNMDRTGTDDVSHSSTTSTDGTLYELSGQDSKYGTNLKTTTDNGTVTTEESYTATAGTSSTTKSDTEATTTEHKEVKTGRSGMPPQEALKSASAWIKQSRAFNWLTKELDSCFMQIL